jgi:hypothetical protein
VTLFLDIRASDRVESSPSDPWALGFADLAF